MLEKRYVLQHGTKLKLQIRHPYFMVVCADLKSWKDNPAQYWKNAPKEAQDFSSTCNEHRSMKGRISYKETRP